MGKDKQTQYQSRCRLGVGLLTGKVIGQAIAKPCRDRDGYTPTAWWVERGGSAVPCLDLTLFNVKKIVGLAYTLP